MTTPQPPEQRPLPSESEKHALVTLLSDEDPQVYRTVREKLLSYGSEVRGWLLPYRLSPDPTLRRRVSEILDHLAAREADNELLSFCINHGQKLNLEEGAWLLARTRYPGISPEGYRALLDSYASQLRERIDFGKPADKILAGINQLLFQELEFHGNEEDYYDPENSYLNRVIDRRAGNPINLSLLYLLIAHRLGLPIVGVGMPGHFLCRYQTHREEIFIDAFNKGKLLSKRDCIRFLHQSGYGYKEGFLGPVSSRRLLMRICANLHRIHSGRDDWEEVARMQRYIVALGQ